MTTLSLTKRLDRARLARTADALVLAVAASLPWSTSATGVLLVLWLAALVPTLDRSELRRAVSRAAGALPPLLVALGALGMIWADVPLYARWDGLESFLKLLCIPLLFAQYRRSDRGEEVFAAYVASCVVLLVLSYAMSFWPDLRWFSRDYAVPVKNAASQSGEFATCIFGLMYLAYDAAQRGERKRLAVLCVVIAALAANIVFIATGRTALAVIAVLLVLFAAKKLSARGAAAVFLVAGVIAAAAWFASPYLRGRVSEVWTDYAAYERTHEPNSSGERVVFAERSIEFIRAAPVIGHGTGTIRALFARAAAGKTGTAGVVAANPHNQTLAVAIQIGLVGAAVLWAMWIAHLLLFRGPTLVGWIGLVLVTQNIVGSLLNSHLFDFLQGWTYVIGVGVAGGMVVRAGAVEGGADRP